MVRTTLEAPVSTRNVINTVDHGLDHEVAAGAGLDHVLEITLFRLPGIVGAQPSSSA